jgi:myo-inositol-1(or 4)-monophosphatase
LAYVASGASDAFFHFGGIHCWDVVAGALILIEAGGYVCDVKTGGELNYMDRHILAASSKVRCFKAN